MVAPIQQSTFRNPADVAARLSPRERQTLALLLRGLSDKEVARELSISSHTVHAYAKRLHEEFAVNSRGELLAVWVDPAAIDHIEATAALDVRRRRFSGVPSPHPDARTEELLVLRRYLLSQLDAVDNVLAGQLTGRNGRPVTEAKARPGHATRQVRRGVGTKGPLRHR
jgi:DNA-binding CsgD family transcriptional regulator